MEHNETLDNEFEALRNISNADFDDLLQFHNSEIVDFGKEPEQQPLERSLPNTIMKFNREQFSSQIDNSLQLSSIDTPIGNAFEVPASKPFSIEAPQPNTDNNYCSPSVSSSCNIIEQSLIVCGPTNPNTCTMDAIVLDDSSVLSLSAGVAEAEVVSKMSSLKRNTPANVPHFTISSTITAAAANANDLLDLSSLQPTPNESFSSYDALLYHQIDADLQLQDVDFEQIDALERSYRMSKTQAHDGNRLAKAVDNTSKTINTPRNYTCPAIPLRGSFPQAAVASQMTSMLPSARTRMPAPVPTISSISTIPPLSAPNLEDISQQTQDIQQPLDFSNRTLNAAAAERSQIEPNVLPNDNSKQNENMSEVAMSEGEGSERAELQHDSTTDATFVPGSVKQLYDAIKAQYSDFAFVYALSAQLCQERVPMDCLVTLKMGLLLSLASIGPNPNRPPIPVIALGHDTYMLNYLITEIGQLAERYISAGEDTVKASSATAGGAYRTYNWIEADPIVLAKGGVYAVGDWAHLKTARAEQIFKIVECSRIDLPKTVINYPLETAIWTHWRAFKYNSQDQQKFNKFLKVFGIPLIGDEAKHEVLVDFVLEQSAVQQFETSVDHLSISAEDMREYLAAISKRTVDLNADASAILQKYFVACRAERPDCLSKQAFVVLKQFAESFAKLAFRHEVTVIDAVGAIFMCEVFLQNVFGENMQPPPKFESQNYVGNVDKYLKKFHKWLKKYIRELDTKA